VLVYQQVKFLNFHHFQVVFQQKIDNFYQENNEVYEKLIKAKDEQIQLLMEQINFYKSRIK
jgi:hypothetical protein